MVGLLLLLFPVNVKHGSGTLVRAPRSDHKYSKTKRPLLRPLGTRLQLLVVPTSLLGTGHPAFESKNRASESDLARALT